MPFGRIRCFHHVLQLSGAIFVNFLCPTSHVISIHWYNFVNKLGRNFVRFATFAEFAGYVCGRFWNPSSQLISTPSFKFVRRFADSWIDSLYWENFHRSANPSKLLSLHVITCYCTNFWIHLWNVSFYSAFLPLLTMVIWVCLNLLSTVQ